MREDLPHELKALFERARRDEDPSKAERMAVRRALTARLGLAAAGGASVTLSAGTAAAHAGAASAAGITAPAIAGKMAATGTAAVWLMIGAMVGTGVSLAPVFVRTSSAPEFDSTARPTSRAPAAPVPERGSSDSLSTIPPAPSGTGPTASPAAKLESKRSQSSSNKPRAPDQPASESDPGRLGPTALKEETRALAGVQQALRDEQPENALRLLEAQDRTFPNGALQAERAAARVLALCAGHQVIAARAAAAQFLRNHPESPLAHRIRESCAK